MRKNLQVSLIGGGYLPNIGNGFYEKGIKILMKNILQENEYMHSMNMGEFSCFEKELGYRGSAMVYKQKIDILIVAGMIVHNKWWYNPNRKAKKFTHGDMLEKVLEINPKCKIILLGVGVSKSCNGEIFFQRLNNVTKKYPNCLAPVITRDRFAYNLFIKHKYQAYDGICCASYLYYKKMPELQDRNKFNIISDDELGKTLKNSKYYNENTIILQHGSMNQRRVGTFIVRSLDEFLILLSNTSYIITNRLHGYIPALVYKRPVKFMLSKGQKMNARRKGVLEKFPIKKENGFDILDEEKLEIILDKQKKFVEKIFNNLRKSL